MTRKVCLSALMLAWALCSGVAAAAHASGTEAGHGQIEAGMRVRGEITVDTTGNVVGYKLHEEKKLPALVATFVRDSIASWKFQPLALEGSAMAVRNTMELFVVARQRDEQYELRMQAVGFRPTERAHGYEVTVTSLTPPTFPAYAMGTGAAGTVYLLLRVGRDGAVQDVVAEQVNLHVRGSADMLATLRSAFETASVDAARTWRFAPPVHGELASAKDWSVRVPIDFKSYAVSSSSRGAKHERAARPARYGQWIAYVPGPRRKAAWLPEDTAGTSPEALAAGVPHLVERHGLRLLAPLGGDS
ncbi:hypothetical protein LJR143_003466 [Pseudoxanthomonas sp. LjRoot143]|uniref:hypothetical protein n=1 Tax=Pseudoxanthomonas sp. LjRoot143 TaxID=3342266 RepID=UPI003ECE8DDE